jgi:hypothetical protein
VKSAKLTEAMKQRPVLFEINRKSHENSEMESRAWKEIAEKLGIDGKLIWINRCMFGFWIWIFEFF